MTVDAATDHNVKAVNDVFRRALRKSLWQVALGLLAMCAVSIIAMMGLGASLAVALLPALGAVLSMGIAWHDLKRLLKKELVIMPRERVMVECGQDSFRIAVGTSTWRFPFRAVRGARCFGDETSGRFSWVLRIDVGASEELVVPLEAEGIKCLSDWVSSNHPYTYAE